MTATNGTCVFCGIVSGVVPSHTIYEDDLTLAFLDINPASEGHTLVIPKRHADDLFAIGVDDLAAVMSSAKVVADLLDERLTPDGLTVIQTNRRAGWQDVMHLHVHLVPRWRGDSLRAPWTPRAATPDKLKLVAQKLKPKLDMVDDTGH